MVKGRPRKPSEGLCPNPKCRKPGYPFGKYVPRNDSTDLYFYPWFRHEDGTKDCNLSKILGKYKARQKIVVEFNRSKNETTDYHYYPRHRHKFLKEFPLKEAHISKTLPLVVYELEKLGQNLTIPNFMGMCFQCYGHCTHIHDIGCQFCNNTTIVWCPKCQLHCDFSRKVPSINGTTFEKDTIRNELKKSNVKVAELTDINWFLETSNRITKRAAISSNNYQRGV